jgi:hypothetical protein
MKMMKFEICLFIEVIARDVNFSIIARDVNFLMKLILYKLELLNSRYGIKIEDRSKPTAGQISHVIVINDFRPLDGRTGFCVFFLTYKKTV